MKKLSNMLLALILVFSFSVTSISAEEPATDTNPVEVPEEETDNGNEPESEEEDEPTEGDSVGFDAEALRADLKNGLYLGSHIDVNHYYNGEQLLEIREVKGTVQTVKSIIIFTTPGYVEFLVTDGLYSVYFEVEISENRAPANVITFDTPSPTVKVGESIDLMFEFLFLGEYVTEDIIVVDVKGDAVEYEAIYGETHGVKTVIGYTVIGLKEGESTLTVSMVDEKGDAYEQFALAVANITVVAGGDVIEPEPTTIEGFDAEALRADLKNGLYLGSHIDVNHYYNGEQLLEIREVKGTVQTVKSIIIFTTPGYVEFLVTDGLYSVYFEVEISENRAPANVITFDTPSPTVKVGESIDLMFQFLFLGEYVTEDIIVVDVKGDAVEYEAIYGETHGVKTVIGYTVIGLKEGESTLTVSMVDEKGDAYEQFALAVANITVVEAEEELPEPPATIEDFDEDQFEELLADGITQGEFIDLKKFYDGDYSITAIATEGALLTSPEDLSLIMFPEAGIVSFYLAEYDGYLPSREANNLNILQQSEVFTIEVLADEDDGDLTPEPTPATGITFDNTSPTIKVGESADLLLDVVTEDGYFLEESVWISASLSSEDIVRVERILSEVGSIQGYRVYGLKEGTVALVVNVIDEDGNVLDEYTPAVANITVVAGEGDNGNGGNGDDAVTPSPVTNNPGPAGGNPVDTSDNTLVSTYVMTTMLSLAALTYILYSKKRSIIGK